ncbi:MAG: mechanosensitive ion channel family protein, partial [Sulfurimonas sp.]|nr:mechanosensitive ion channel family protein [Sulfurimonas sp.]
SKIKSLKIYSKDILNSIRKLLETLFIVINLELTLYVYNDYSSISDLGIYFNIIYAFIITFIIYTTINTIANIKLKEISAEDKKIKNEVINVSIKLLNVFIWIVGILVILHMAGVELTAVISGLGIGGLAVALASKDSLANFFGTLSILFSDVFSQGDWIAVDGKEGTVVEIGLRVTKLRTFDNALIAIPNAVLANQDVKNWNKRSLGRRIKMHVGVKYDSKREDIQNAIAEIYDMLDKHPGIATKNTKHSYTQNSKKFRAVVSKDDEEGVKKTLLVYLDEFGDSSINILIYCFSKSVRWQEWLEVKQDVMFNIMNILEKNSLEFAFPSVSLYHENELDADSSKKV